METYLSKPIVILLVIWSKQRADFDIPLQVQCSALIDGYLVLRERRSDARNDLFNLRKVVTWQSTRSSDKS